MRAKERTHAEPRKEGGSKGIALKSGGAGGGGGEEESKGGDNREGTWTSYRTWLHYVVKVGSCPPPVGGIP